MGLKDCLATAVAGKEITQADADRLGREFDRFRARAAIGSDTTADAEAKAALQELLKAETAHQKRKAALALASIKTLAADLDGFRNSRGEADVAAAALYKLENHGEATFDGVAGRHLQIVGMAHARMESLLYAFRRSALWGDKVRKNPAALRNVVREAFGEDTGDLAAKGLAEVWGDTAEWLRQRFNAAGGAVPKLERWGLPQHHDPLALRKAGKTAWTAYITPLLDLNRMTHPLTGKPVTAGELGDVLSDIWDGAVTDGWDRREPKRQAFGRGALANQRADHRFLVFRDADSWLKYQADFGGGSDPFGAMMGHVNMMARDIGAMEVLGPNPTATVEWLKQVVMKEGNLKAAGKPARFAGRGDPLGRVTRYTSRLDDVWGSIRGTLNTPVNGRWAALAAGARDFITASVLGSATLSTGSDVATSAVTRRFAGISGSASVDIIRAMLPATRREAVAAGLILDNAAHVLHEQARYVGTFGGPEWVRFLGDRVLTYSGLTPWTQSARHAFGLAFMHEAAKSAAKGFDALHPLFRRKFAEYGIGPAEWDKIRAAAQHPIGGGTNILRPAEIAKLDGRLAERYLGMIQSETEYAVPSGTHRSRTLLINQNQPGTIPGEILRSFAQFKSFGAVFAMLHWGRVAAMLTGKEAPLGAAYAGALLISATLAGAAGIQLKQLAGGRDPRAMTNAAFWGAALLQGGGFGLYGDFFFSDINRYGGGLGTSIAGPLAERANDFSNLTLGNLIQLATGQKTDFGRELLKFASGNVPGGNIWFLRLAWQRIVLDQLSYLADPEANKAFKRQQQFWQRNFGQGFWWQPGRNAPSRAPNMAAMAGG